MSQSRAVEFRVWEMVVSMWVNEQWKMNNEKYGILEYENLEI